MTSEDQERGDPRERRCAVKVGGAGGETARVEIGAIRENLAIDLKPGGLACGFKLRAEIASIARSGEIARTARAIASATARLSAARLPRAPCGFT